MELRGKTVWLIGASEGIGAALAVQLVAAGATLAMSSRSDDKLRALAMRMPGVKPLVIPMDVADPGSVDAGWSALREAWERLDMVIYNAGTYEPMDATSFNLPKIEAMLKVNLCGALHVLAFALPFFLAQKSGHIALVGSVAGYRGLPSSMGYGLSKAALIHLAENLRADLVTTNIGVTLINPGFVKTRLTDKNTFRMPAIITPEAAAQAIMRGFARDDFEIHFPRKFTYVMKLLQLLPYGLYFRVLKILKL